MCNGLEITTQEDLLDLHGLPLPIPTVIHLSMPMFKKFTAMKLVDVNQITLMHPTGEILLLLMEVRDHAKHPSLYLFISLMVLGHCNGHGLVEHSNWVTIILVSTTRSLEDLLVLRKKQYFMEEIIPIPIPTSASSSTLIDYISV